MRYSLIVGCVLLAHGSVFAADSYTIDPSHTFPRFEINHFGFSTHHGQFNKTSGKIVLDRAARTGSVDISVATSSTARAIRNLKSICGRRTFSMRKNFRL